MPSATLNIPDGIALIETNFWLHQNAPHYVKYSLWTEKLIIKKCLHEISHYEYVKWHSKKSFVQIIDVKLWCPSKGFVVKNEAYFCATRLHEDKISVRL